MRRRDTENTDMKEIDEEHDQSSLNPDEKRRSPYLGRLKPMKDVHGGDKSPQPVMSQFCDSRMMLPNNYTPLSVMDN